MGIFVAIPMTILAFWTTYKLYDYTDRNSTKLILFLGVLVAACILTVIICKLLGLDFYGPEIYESVRGSGPFRW